QPEAAGKIEALIRIRARVQLESVSAGAARGEVREVETDRREFERERRRRRVILELDATLANLQMADEQRHRLGGPGRLRGLLLEWLCQIGQVHAAVRRDAQVRIRRLALDPLDARTTEDRGQVEVHQQPA